MGHNAILFIFLPQSNQLLHSWSQVYCFHGNSSIQIALKFEQDNFEKFLIQYLSPDTSQKIVGRFNKILLIFLTQSKQLLSFYPFVCCCVEKCSVNNGFQHNMLALNKFEFFWLQDANYIEKTKIFTYFYGLVIVLPSDE